jgi:GTP-binding protein EngB required for normal cell division
MDSNGSLNSSHRRHLLSHFKYVDDLLSDIESVLVSSASKSPFPKYRADLSPVQTKVIRDYIAQIRAQMLQVLKSQGISPPDPDVPATRSVRVNLVFADIAIDECRPDALRGYGEVPPSRIPELNGLVEEIRSLLRKVGTYVAGDRGEDFQARLRRLERTSDEVELLKTLERIINDRGLVEFRSTLSTILDRLESSSFQIAVFGRVSSGKSSLLNHIIEMNVLPVGVNPITAVPTRIVHGAESRLSVTFVDKKAEIMEVARLAEFVSEQFNPGNSKHVTRIVVELPARRLHDGVVFVDTPGLGSLATAGSAETIAYLPQCDLGVILVDAGSTLTQEDLSTVQSLYQAAIPAFVLLSKADLISAEDRERSVDYVSQQIRTQLGLDVSVYAVSARGEHAGLLETWFEHEIQPLCERHQELAQQSIRRKIGTLRDAVEAALKVKLEIAEEGPKKDREHLTAAETQLRTATGKFEEVNTWSLRASNEIRQLGWIALTRAAGEIAESWLRKEASVSGAQEIVLRNLTGTAAEGANQIFTKIRDLAGDLSNALAAVASALDAGDRPGHEDLTSFAKEVPRFDPGPIRVALRRNMLTVLGKAFTKRRIEGKLLKQIGSSVDEGFHRYGKMLEAWSRSILAEIHRQFDAHADAYRAQLERLTGGGKTRPEEADAIKHDLQAVSQLHSELPVQPTR